MPSGTEHSERTKVKIEEEQEQQRKRDESAASKAATVAALSARHAEISRKRELARESQAKVAKSKKSK